MNRRSYSSIIGSDIITTLRLSSAQKSPGRSYTLPTLARCHHHHWTQTHSPKVNPIRFNAKNPKNKWGPKVSHSMEKYRKLGKWYVAIHLGNGRPGARVALISNFLRSLKTKPYDFLKSKHRIRMSICSKNRLYAPKAVKHNELCITSG